MRDSCPTWVVSTARWIDTVPPAAGSDERFRRFIAQACIDDIDAADAVVAFTTWGLGSGGLLFEAGFAIARGKGLVVVGPPESDFFFLSPVHRAAHFSDALDALAPQCALGEARLRNA